MYLLPNDKYVLLKAIVYGLVVLDGGTVNINRLKKINVKDIDRIFKHNPVAPLFGDVSLTLANLIKELKHYDPNKWSCTLDEVESRTNLSISHRMGILRHEHLQTIAELAKRNNEYKTSNTDMSEVD